MRAEHYADEFRRDATFIKDYSGNHIQKIASGSHDNEYKWTDVLMAQAAGQMQGISLHYYTVPTAKWDKKGSATDFDESQWLGTMIQAQRLDEFIQKHSAIMDKYDPGKRVGLIIDEWGTWYDPAPGRNMGILFQQNTIRDAIVAGLNFNIFQQHADRVQMANIAQMVNVLQSMILTDKDKIVLTPTYYVFEMYKVHQGATVIPIELVAPEYKFGAASTPSLSATASRDSSGKLHLSIVNLDPNREAEVSTKLVGVAGKNISGRVLTAPAINSMNTFDNPQQVMPVAFTGFKMKDASLMLSLPSKSVVVLEIE